MKTFLCISLMLWLALAGCTPADEPEAPDVEEATEEVREEIEEVGEEVGEAYEAAKEYSFAQKSELETWSRARLRELNAQMEQLQNRMDEVPDAVQERYRETVADLEAQRDAVEEQLKSLQESSAEAWADTKSDVLSAMEELERGVQDALAELDEGEA